MKADIKFIIITLLFFTVTSYSKGTPPKPINLSIKQDFFKIPNKSLEKIKSIDLIKPASIPPDSNIDFREFFQF